MNARRVFPPTEASERDRGEDRGRARQAELTKPPGSLGALEQVAIDLGRIQGVERPTARPAAALLFASDHPVVKHGVAALPQSVAAGMVANFARGGAAASVTCQAPGIPLEVHDVGVVESALVGVGSNGVTVSRYGCSDAPGGDLRVAGALDRDLHRETMRAGAPGAPGRPLAHGRPADRRIGPRPPSANRTLARFPRRRRTEGAARNNQSLPSNRKPGGRARVRAADPMLAPKVRPETTNPSPRTEGSRGGIGGG